jgi:hypothetical protein
MPLRFILHTLLATYHTYLPDHDAQVDLDDARGTALVAEPG